MKMIIQSNFKNHYIKIIRWNQFNNLYNKEDIFSNHFIAA